MPVIYGLLLFVSILLLLAAVALSSGIEFFTLTCSDDTTNLCDYQSFFAGGLALIAAIVSGWIVYANHVSASKADSIKIRQNWHYNKYKLARIFSADISAQLRAIKHSEYRENFETQLESLQSKKITSLSSFVIVSDFFVLYKAHVTDICLLPSELIVLIINWYTEAMELNDTIIGIDKGEFLGSDQEELAQHLIDMIDELNRGGLEVIKALDAYSAKQRDKLSVSHREYKSITGVSLDY